MKIMHLKINFGKICWSFSKIMYKKIHWLLMPVSVIASAQSGHGLGSSHWPGSRHQREGKEHISCVLWVLFLVRPCFSYTSSSAPPLPLSLHPPICSGFSHLTNKQQNKANYFPFLFTVKLLLEVVFIFLTSPTLTLFFHSFTPMIFQKLFSWKH